MKKIFPIIFIFIFLLGKAQQKESINSLLSELNQTEYKIIYNKKNYKQLNSNYFLVPIKELGDFKIFYPFKNLNVKNSITVCSGGNILIFSKKYKKYLAINFFTGECLTKLKKNIYKLKLQYDIEYLNYQSLFFAEKFTPVYYINFYPTLKNNYSSNYILVQKIKDKKVYQLNLDERFYKISLEKIFEIISTKKEEEYSDDYIINKSSFPFLK
ncbi:hypothetical protein [Chryseobacterium sp.]|uniref:hypothetical protein n=1 Tax=Chryseobacterium sp. TaxID=1871047 RepID=UPI00388E10C8